MAITFRKIVDANRDEVLALRTTTEQERFVSSVPASVREAAAHPEASPWYRAVYDGDVSVGFVMLSWDCVPQPPHINGPWFLWKLIVDQRYQGRGYGREIVGQVVDIVRANGGTELMTSHVPRQEDGDEGPAGFYARLGFVPTGELDPDGEILMRLPV